MSMPNYRSGAAVAIHGTVRILTWFISILLCRMPETILSCRPELLFSLGNHIMRTAIRNFLQYGRVGFQDTTAATMSFVEVTHVF
jgi:hypothetical protein